MPPDRSNPTDFVKVIGHDLNAPLRGIRMFAELLESDLSDRLSSDERHLFDQLQAGVKSMGDMLGGLADHARLQRPFSLDERFETGTAVNRLGRELGCELENDALPDLTGDGIQLELLFHRLIENVVHHSGLDRPRATVTSRDEGGRRIIVIADRGAGVRADRIAELTGVFYSTRKGHLGLGLANARLVADNHSAEMQIESAENEGFSVSLSFPLPPAS